MSNCSLVFFNGDVLRCDDVGFRHQQHLALGTPPSDPQVSRGARTLRWPQPRTVRWPRTPVGGTSWSGSMACRYRANPRTTDNRLPHQLGWPAPPLAQEIAAVLLMRREPSLSK